MQKGRVGARTWRADDNSVGALLAETVTSVGTGRDVAVFLSAAQDVASQARTYMAKASLDVGTILEFSFATGPGQQSVMGAAHGAALAEQIANAVRRVKAEDLDAVVHLFASAPNSILFYLGQQDQAIAPCIVYEFDFDRRGDKSYHPSFMMD